MLAEGEGGSKAGFEANITKWHVASVTPGSEAYVTTDNSFQALSHSQTSLS
jgi:hypothetical protein